jgi:hypothetical protein
VLLIDVMTKVKSSERRGPTFFSWKAKSVATTPTSSRRSTDQLLENLAQWGLFGAERPVRANFDAAVAADAAIIVEADFLPRLSNGLRGAVAQAVPARFAEGSHRGGALEKVTPGETVSPGRSENEAADSGKIKP